MGVIKKIHCQYKKICDRCNYELIVDYKKRIDVANKQALSTKHTYKHFENLYLNCQNINDFIEIGKIGTNINRAKVQENKTYNCCKKPRICHNEFVQVIEQYNIATNTLADNLNEIEQMINIINQMDKCITENKENEHVFIRFKLDKFKKLVGFYLNYSKVFSVYSNLTIYGFVGLYSPPVYASRDKIKMDISVSLSDKESSSITIVDFFSIKNSLRRKYGTLALEFLLEFVDAINNILAKDEIYHFNEMMPIAYITGTMVPHKEYITKEELFEFYKVNGFIHNGELKKYIDSNN